MGGDWNKNKNKNRKSVNTKLRHEINNLERFSCILFHPFCSTTVHQLAYSLFFTQSHLILLSVLSSPSPYPFLFSPPVSPFFMLSPTLHQLAYNNRSITQSHIIPCLVPSLITCLTPSPSFPSSCSPQWYRHAFTCWRCSYLPSSVQNVLYVCDRYVYVSRTIRDDPAMTSWA